MNNKLLLLVPALLSITGCSEKIEAHENDNVSSEIEMPPDQKEAFLDHRDEQEPYIEPRSPQDLD